MAVFARSLVGGHTPLFKWSWSVCRHQRMMGAMGKSWKEQKPTGKGQIKKNLEESIHCLYVNDQDVASMVVKHISQDLIKERACIFEASPGIGLVTQELINAGVKNLRVFEENSAFLDQLYKLESQHPDRLKVFNSQILNLPQLLWKLENPNRHPNLNLELEESNLKKWFADIPVHSWDDEPSIKFFAVLSPINASLFLRFIIRQLIRHEYFFSSGRTQFLVFMSGSELVYMQAKHGQNYNTYRASSVLYQSLFDIEVLESVEWTNFLPQVKHQKMKMKSIDNLNAHLIRLTPKTRLKELSPEDIWDYYYFVNQTFMRRKNWVIPFLEKWFPNCGPRIIKMGIPVFKYFGDLTPEEVYNLYIYLLNSSDYHGSVFKEAAIQKLSSYWDFNREETEESHEDHRTIDYPLHEHDSLGQDQQESPDDWHLKC